MNLLDITGLHAGYGPIAALKGVDVRRFELVHQSMNRAVRGNRRRRP